MYNKQDNRVKWQIDCDNTIKEKNYVILSSPTGSGKTKRYENWAFNKPERPIFITSPIKALSNQKFRELQKNGYKVGLETGDIKYIPSGDCDIICCTQEIYNSKYRDYRNSTLIIDEFSYIFEDKERARAYIDSLYYSEAKNIMICSATFGNAEKIRQYINKITNTEFFLYENKERLTTLDYEGEISKDYIKDSLVVAYTKSSCEAIAKSIYRNRIDKYQEILKNMPRNNYDPRDRNRSKILDLAKKYNITNEELLDLATMGVVYYYGSLYPKEKLFIEELFEKKLIDTVVGTDALALGVNFPIKNVVFAQLKKIRNSTNTVIEIEKNLFEQLSGRAGRKGYFDDGHVYYCNDFFKDYDNYTKHMLSSVDNKQLFYKLVNQKNEDARISLTPNIRDILVGDKTIEEEALFITEYSTVEKDFDEEKNNITEIIDYIKSFDVAFNYLKRKFRSLNFEQGYYIATENCTPKIKRKIEKLSNELMRLQPYFDKDIGTVYQIEYSPAKNCLIFIDILMDTPMKTLIKRYGNSFYDLLLLRKYMYNLPKKYSDHYVLKEIDEEINNLDYTALHPYEIDKIKSLIKQEDADEQTVTITPANHKKENNLKDKNSGFKCPNYFDIMSIDGKQYVKILKDDNYILACNYSKSDSLNLYIFPKDIKYRLSGLIKPSKGLDILNKLNFSSLNHKNKYNIIKQIEQMKVSIIKKYQLPETYLNNNSSINNLENMTVSSNSPTSDISAAQTFSSNKKRNNKKNKEIKCPNYFDEIIIDGKTYIKILRDDNGILVCDYPISNNFDLYYLPKNTIYKLSGLISPKKGLKFLNKLTLDSTTYKDEDIVDEIEQIKTSLRNKYGD